MTRRQLTLEEYREEVKQRMNGGKIDDVKFVCPRCEAPQSAADLIEAGAGDSVDEVEKYLAFSCVGRFTKDKGCDWTLGGLFSIHELEVLTPDGTLHPRFEFYDGGK